ncbi:MAG: membrane protein insertion efficiency factor YidD [Kofleriaceae bacterium]|nr:membrane protein insertion efficiency factor YidD [Kofleriaceae bacterium]
MLTALLVGLILFYRRFLSGRGPFRAACSFAGHESCSAYGLRVARTSGSLRVAIARIARRLGRCRDAYLVGDGRVLSWAHVHDRPPQAIVDEMRADAETAPAIGRMLGARRAVAWWRGDLASVRACTGADVQRPRVTPDAGRVRRGVRKAGLYAALAGAILLTHVPWLAIVPAVGALLAVRTFVGERLRFALHARWAARRYGVSGGTGITAPAIPRAK